MINHARSLLLNLDGAPGYFPDYPGDELIPAEYHAIVTPTYLSAFRSRFFGVTPDRAMLNYRTAQLLQLIESTELQQHILALDPRITYDSPTATTFASTKFVPQILRQGGTTADSLMITGTAIDPDSSGVVRYDYRVTMVPPNIQIQRITFPSSLDTYPLILTTGLSAQMPLPYSGYQVRVNTANPAVSWTVRGFLRPQLSLTTIEQGLRTIGEPQLLQLFGVAAAEPYATFRNCWENHPEFAYRLGGLVLAMIYRSEENRNGG